MKRIVLALIVCPVVVAAQKPERPRFFEVATGVTAFPDRVLELAGSPRLVMEMWSAISASATTCKPRTGPCTSDDWMTMADLTPGIAAARRATKVGPYTAVRASAYALVMEPGTLLGGYAGVGYATPTSFGGLAFEIGVSGYVAGWRP